MSHFEYVSVAVALLYALVIGKLVSGIRPALEPSQRYSVHAAWVVVLLLVVAVQWWGIWGVREVEWSSFRFVWILSLPSLMLVDAGLLVDQGPATRGYRDLFFERRVRHFSILGLFGVTYTFLPWILGVRPWFTIGPIHSVAGVLLGLAAAGLIFRSHLAHVTIVALTLGVVLLGLVPGVILAV